MSHPLFAAPRAKVRRALSHISEFEHFQASLINNPPFRVTAEDDPNNPNAWRRVVRDHQDLPDDVPLMIGDAIHNLRSSLDLLANDLVRANGGDTSGVYFPFCKHGDDLEQMIRRRNINRCAPDVIEIIRQLKPFSGGNDALRAVHDLDIADKHQLLIPTLMAILQPSLEIDFVNQIMIERPQEECETQIENGSVLLDGIPNDTPRDAFDGNKNVVLFVFAPDQPLAGHGVLESLQDLSQLVNGIIETFASHVLGSDTGA